jgi:hypothetical protein
MRDRTYLNHIIRLIKTRTEAERFLHGRDDTLSIFDILLESRLIHSLEPFKILRLKLIE